MLDPDRRASRRRSPSEAARRSPSRKSTPAERATPSFTGAHAKVGPYEDADGVRYEVRLEAVPGGVRLAEWAGSQLRRRAPVLPAGDVAALIAGAPGALAARDAEALAAALRSEASEASSERAGVSHGRSGVLQEELRVEALEDGRVRIARWILRPGRGWELQDAPPMLPATRYAEALAGAARSGIVAATSSLAS